MIQKAIVSHGARLYCEIRGSKAHLLLIHGGSGDASFFTKMAEQLSASYTVVCYDRRCASRSGGDPAIDMSFEQSVSDARVIIEQCCGGSAIVFGTSLGAAIALSLAEKHPELCQKVIVHEPPLYQLDEDDNIKAFTRQIIHERLPLIGPEAALAEFAQTFSADPEPECEFSGSLPQYRAANIAYFLSHELLTVAEHVFSLNKLTQLNKQLIVAVGQNSPQESFLKHLPIQLAQKLCCQLAVVPGHHCAPAERPQAFAAAIGKLLANSAKSGEICK